MLKPVRALFAAVIVTLYSLLAPFGYGVFMLWGLLPTSDPCGRARKLQAVMRRAFTLMHDTLRAARLLDFNPRHIAGATLPPGPCVIVGNHPTLCDVTATMAAFEDVTTAIKPALYRRALFRPLLQGALQFEGAESQAAVPRMVQDAVERIHQGFRVLIFPEGTRSPEGEVGRFGRTAFEIACQTNVPIVPLVVTCTPVWLSKEHGIFPLPRGIPRVTLTALPPVYPADHGFSSRKLRDVVEAGIQLRLGTSVPHAPAHEADARSGKTTEEPDRRVLDAGGCQP